MVCALANETWAQQRPDAGRLLDDNRRPPAQIPGPSESPIVEEPIRPALKPPAGFRFKLSGFRFTGSSAFPEPDLQALLRDFVGQEVTLVELQQAADRITRYYREHGYFVARAYVPAQDIRDGLVEILILEGKLGQIDVKKIDSVRLKPHILTSHVTAAVPPGTVLREEPLERALLLLNDLPGIQTQATLMPGSQQAFTNVRLDTLEGPLFTGTAEYDNYADKFTGTNRYSASLNLNDPLGIGDQATLRYSGSTGQNYARLGYAIPVGSDGLIAGAAYTYSDYELCCEFDSLKASGDAQVITANVSYPFLRSRSANLIGSLSFDHKAFLDRTVVGTIDDKRAKVVTASLAYDSRDGLFGGGNNLANLILVGGYLDLGLWPPNEADDKNTAKTQGGYAKTLLRLARLQALKTDWTLYTALSFQYAFKNLDSSEQITLGGPYGVRSYPVNEAPGDQGMLLNVELRRDFDANLQGLAFIDYGHITLHHQTWPGWQGTNEDLPNNYGLSSAGLGLNWIKPGDYSLHTILAQRVGSNPGRSPNGDDSDGAHNNTRLWLQAIKYF
jgi:hemolysin activation/secretion protein